LCYYYVTYLEEEATDSEQLVELAKLRASFNERGLLTGTKTVLEHYMNGTNAPSEES
jgi:hypothetical protein